MTKVSISELAATIGKQRKFSPKDVEKFIVAMFGVVNEGLSVDRQVKVKGLGTFKVTSVKPRESVNVNTGERVIIESHDKISFTPDAVMRDLVNKPFAQFETVVLKDDVDFDDVEHDNSATDKADEVLERDKKNVERETEKPITVLQNEKEEEVTESEKLQIEKGEESVADSKSTIDSNRKISSEKPVAYDIVTENVNSGAQRTPEKTHDEESSVVSRKELEEVRENMETLMYENCNRNRRSILSAIVVSVLCFITGLFLGLFLNNMFVPRNTDKSVAVKSSKDTVSRKKPAPAKIVKPVKETLKPTAKQEKDEPNFERMNADPRVRIGAYKIVGIDTVVTLKHGQTMKSYCNATLGSGMLCYFQVLNDTTELGEGAKLKVPKVRLK